MFYLDCELECRVGLALTEEVASGDGAYAGVLCEIEVNCTEAWVMWCIYITRYYALHNHQLELV